MTTSRDGILALAMPLPEDIMKHKWAGDFQAAQVAIDRRLSGELPSMLRARLLCEKERIRRLPVQYPWNRAEALSKLREVIPDMTDEEFAACEEAGIVDFIYIHGERRYFLRFHRSMAKRREFLARAGGSTDSGSPWLDPMIDVIRTKGELTRRITLEASIATAPEAWKPGVYRAWLPIAAVSAQQSEIRVLEGNYAALAPENAHARTAYFEAPLGKGERFHVRYSYLSHIRYADPMHSKAPCDPLYPNALPPCEDDLAEDGVYIRFTPYLRSLCTEIITGAKTQLEKAYAIYQWITTHVKYSFVRNYFQIDDIGEYCAVNLQGDCGLQAILLINLFRIAGIPARWQSGLSLGQDGAGCHDWAQFYLDGWGWLFADPSFGGGAYRAGSLSRHAFYFGNLDPMRMAANRTFMAEFEPPMRAYRVDPTDNQTGEMELLDAETSLMGRDLDEDVTIVGWEDVEC